MRIQQSECFNEFKLYQNIIYLTDTTIIVIIMKIIKTLVKKENYLEKISQLWMRVNEN